MPRLPVPSECCGDIYTEVHIGNFVDDEVTVAVVPTTHRPICSCAPLDPATEPAAYRVDLESATARSMDHCGRSIPWLTRDGRALVCEDRDGVRLGLAARDGRFEPLTEGPFDFAALPLDRDDTDGCAVRPR
jgi:hypothetical protein